MKISVIVPIYNCEEYLPALLDSVLAQTYQNFEIILVNDGSQDNSGAICDAYVAKDSRIRVVHQENHGVSYARNRGLELVTGDAVSFIDSDDFLEPDMYGLLAKIMQEHDAQIAHCGYRHIVGKEVRLVHDTKRVIPQTRGESLECFVSGRLFGGGLWNKLFRRELIDGLTFREDLKINEDILFNFQAFHRAERTVFADFALYHYIARFGNSAVFRTPDEKKAADACAVAKVIYVTLAGTELNDLAAERYIRMLSGYYKYCAKYKKVQCRQIAAEIWKAAADARHLGRNMTITVLLICCCPWLYRLLYAVYAKLRKPQWEARKD